MQRQIVEILSAVFKTPADDIHSDASPDSIPSWDSLGHLQMISALEDGFGIKFNIREIQTMDSLRKIETVLKSKVE